MRNKIFLPDTLSVRTDNASVPDPEQLPRRSGAIYMRAPRTCAPRTTLRSTIGLVLASYLDLNHRDFRAAARGWIGSILCYVLDFFDTRFKFLLR